MSHRTEALNAVLLGAAQGRGSVRMMPELLAVLEERGVISEADVLATNVQTFDADLRGQKVLEG
ncbi:hypothetical protein [Deinococcus humi]|uniref:Uncharacterized protein n=1 Tax=Deinococcus humi TaxID=662880 RepID=A0A7W8JVH9_9DEIO|nr:hypothetical protein [Deinococcus humi]MBB5363889.1 hypothetical protein [Deinococcus humi]GGO31627.1 hypothetical protein GCM10008949_27880 [Deinococcus humi]